MASHVAADGPFPLPVDPAAAGDVPAARPFTLDDSALADLELLIAGAFAPSRTFRLPGEGDVFAPTLPADAACRLGETLALRDVTGVVLALLQVERLSELGDRRFAAGPLRIVRRPAHPDFAALRRDPQDLAAGGGPAILVFASNRFHRAELAALAALPATYERRIVAYPAPRQDGLAKERFTTIRALAASGSDVSSLRDPSGSDVSSLRGRKSHEAAGSRFHSFELVLLPWIVRDDAGAEWSRRVALARACGAAALAAEPHEVEAATLAGERCGIAIVALVPHRPDVASARIVACGAGEGGRALAASAALEAEWLAAGLELPAWFSPPSVATLLSAAYPPRHRRGFTVWLTGLSQSGKSTIAAILGRRLLEFGRDSTSLDGDVVRTHLSRGLGFTREDRDLNVRRIGFVAAEITRHGGVVIVAAIAPYRAVREENRARIGEYLEVFVNADVATCEARDQKGQYARARRGEIQGFTGVDDPYEPPEGEFVECRTDRDGPEVCAEQVIAELLARGYLRREDAIA
jgi:adenylyl-sulfate kinase